MNITLSPELEQFVRQEVKSGRFDSIDALIEEALKLMLDQGPSLVELRAKIDEGWADIQAGRTYSPEEARAILDARRQRYADPSD